MGFPISVVIASTIIRSHRVTVLYQESFVHHWRRLWLVNRGHLDLASLTDLPPHPHMAADICWYVWQLQFNKWQRKGGWGGEKGWGGGRIENSGADGIACISTQPCHDSSEEDRVEARSRSSLSCFVLMWNQVPEALCSGLRRLPASGARPFPQREPTQRHPRTRLLGSWPSWAVFSWWTVALEILQPWPSCSQWPSQQTVGMWEMGQEHRWRSSAASAQAGLQERVFRNF